MRSARKTSRRRPWSGAPTSKRRSSMGELRSRWNSASRDIDRVLDQIVERDELERALVGGGEHHRRRDAGRVRFLPAQRAQAPPIAGHAGPGIRTPASASPGRCPWPPRSRGTPRSSGRRRCARRRPARRCRSIRSDRSRSGAHGCTTRDGRRARCGMELDRWVRRRETVRQAYLYAIVTATAP